MWISYAEPEHSGKDFLAVISLTKLNFYIKNLEQAIQYLPL